MAKSSTQRNLDRQNRLRALGLKEVRNCWAHPEDHPAIKVKAASLTRSREKRKKDEK